MRLTCGIGAFTLLSAITGCGTGIFPVSGIVTLDGKPVEGAQVAFEPEGGVGHLAQGWTDENGTFELSCNLGEGALRGEYRVTVRKVTGPAMPDLPPPGPQAGAEEIARLKQQHDEALRQRKSWLPAVYGSAITTPLRCTIPHKGRVALDLKSNAK